MHNRTFRIFFILILIGNYALHSEEFTKVLQNGLNGYQGCTDSYIHSSGVDPSTMYQNHGDEEYLVTAN